MKKILLVAILAVVLAGGGVVWATLAHDKPAADPGTDSGGQNVVMPAGYQPTEEELAWIGTHTSAAGAWVKQFGDYRFVLVTAGEKPTGGYSVEVKTVTPPGSNGSGWTVDVSFVSPGPNDPVIMMITYPYTFVKIKGDSGPIAVRDITGAEPVVLEVVEE